MKTQYVFATLLILSISVLFTAPAFAQIQAVYHGSFDVNTNTQGQIIIGNSSNSVNVGNGSNNTSEGGGPGGTTSSGGGGGGGGAVIAGAGGNSNNSVLCGNGVCDVGESHATCPQDCPATLTGTSNTLNGTKSAENSSQNSTSGSVQKQSRGLPGITGAAIGILGGGNPWFALIVLLVILALIGLSIYMGVRRRKQTNHRTEKTATK